MSANEPSLFNHDALYPRLSNSALLALAGGFLDGFTYVTCNHVFANAMSGNVVLLGISAVSRDWSVSLHHLAPILTFMIAIFAARALHLPVLERHIRRPKNLVLSVELVILTIVSFLPDATPDIWITTAIAFAASIQVETFRTVNGQSFNTTFVTGNLRTLSESLFDWFTGVEPEKARHISRDFAVICGVFLAGATIGGFLGKHFGNHALWAVIALLGWTLYRVRNRADHISTPPEP